MPGLPKCLEMFRGDKSCSCPPREIKKPEPFFQNLSTGVNGYGTEMLISVDGGFHSLEFLYSSLWDETSENPDISSSLYV